MEHTPPVPPIEMETSPAANASIVWLHGLGADGHDFEPIAHEIGRPATRFIFPHAPYRRVTLHGGAVMRAWFDLYELKSDAPQDETGIEDGARSIQELINRERVRGVPPERIVLAGFSQGGALALHTALHCPERIGGVIGLSTYLPLHTTINANTLPVHPHIPAFIAHGTWDPVISLEMGRGSSELLKAKGWDVEWHTYLMGHTVIPDEIADIRSWLARTLP